MVFERFTSARFMMKGTDKGTFSPMTLFSWAAIAIGIGAMCSLLSVMYGFEHELKARVLNAYPHVMIKSKLRSQPIVNYEKILEEVKKLPGLERVTPYIEAEMVLQSDYRTLGGVVWGVDEAELQRLSKNITLGKAPTKNSRLSEALVGSELAGRLGITTGQKLKLISPIQKSGPMGMLPDSQTFEVVGTYTSGHYEFDQGYLFVPLEEAQDMIRIGNTVTGFQVWANTLEDADSLAAQIKTLLPENLEAQSWTEFNSALFNSLKLEQYAMFAILSFAILIAVMNLVITLMMNASNKKKHIGILRALGASANQIRKIFLYQGAWMGLVGIVLGSVLFVSFVVYVKYFSTFQLPEFYYDRSIPVELRPIPLFLVYFVASLLIFLATLLPAVRASRLDPIEAIRE